MVSPALLYWDGALIMFTYIIQGYFITVATITGRLSNISQSIVLSMLSDWGWVTNIFLSKLTIMGSDNGFAPRRTLSEALLEHC